jgi:hypothetical protein
LTHNPKDPELDRKAKLLDEITNHAVAFNSANREAMADAEEGIRFWIKEIEDHAGKSAFNRASDHAAQMEAITKRLQAIGDLIAAIDSSGANYRAVEENIRALLASALKITTRAKVSAEVVTNGGGA